MLRKLKIRNLVMVNFSLKTYSYSFTVTKDCALVAKFIVSTQYSITATASPSNGGTISGAGSHAIGATVTLVATANSSHTFIGWKENNAWIAGPTNNSLSFTVTGNRTLQAMFAPGRPATNYIGVFYENGKQYLRATYPVASSLTIELKDGDGGRRAVVLYSGQIELCIAEDDWYWDIRTITPSSDSYYRYQ